MSREGNIKPEIHQMCGLQRGEVKQEEISGWGGCAKVLRGGRPWYVQRSNGRKDDVARALRHGRWGVCSLLTPGIPLGLKDSGLGEGGQRGGGRRPTGSRAG